MGPKRLVRVAWALALLFAACSKAPLGDAPGFDASVPCEDRDHDGFGRGCERGYDCNDNDPHTTTECRSCSRPERGCECSPGEGPISCFLDDRPLDDGDVLCSEGTRHCRDGVWSGCEDVHQYVASQAPDTQRVIDPSSGKLPCSLCDVKCFQIVDNLLSDGGVAGGNVTFGPGGGITLLPGDAGTGGTGGDGGTGGLSGCAAMMACCSTLSDALKSACEVTAMSGNNAICDRDRVAYCPSGTVSGPVAGCTLGAGADKDCDGIPNEVDSFPGSPITTSNNQTIFHQLDIGETGSNTMNISFKLRNADVYFLLDMTNTMKEERDNLISSLTTGNVINCAHLNQCCNRLSDAAMKASCQAAVKTYTNRAGKADDQDACLVQQSTYCPGNKPVDCPDNDANGLPDNFLKTQGVVGATKCLVGSSWFGAGFSRELPVAQDTVPCTGSACGKTYASRDEQLFKNVIDLTPDYNKVSTALQSMTTDGNWDEPEGGIMALHSVITGSGHYFGINRPSIPPRPAATACPPNTFGYPCFRKDAVPIVVFFTDRPHHNGPPESTNCAGEGSGCPYDQLAKNSSTWTSGPAESSSDKVARFIPLSAETFGTAYNAGDVRGKYLTMVGDTRFMAGDYPTAIVGCGAAPDAADALIRFRVDPPTGATGVVPPIPVNFHLTKDDAYAANLYGTWRGDRADDPTPATEFGAVVSVFRGVPNSVSSTIDLGDRQAYAIASGPDSTYLTYTGTTMGASSGPGFLGGLSDCAADGMTNQVLFTFRPTANARIVVDASQSAFPAVVSLHSGTPSSLPKNPSGSDGSSAPIPNNNDTFATANAVPSGSTTIDGAYVERTGDSNVAAIHADYTAPLSRGVKAVRTLNSDTLTQVSSVAGLQVGTELTSANDWSATPVRIVSIGTDTIKLSAKWLDPTDAAPTSVYFVDSLVGCGVNASGRDTVFKFDVATPRRVRIDTEGSTYDTVISLHDAPPPSFYNKTFSGGNGTASNAYAIGDAYNASFVVTDTGTGTGGLSNTYDYAQCGAAKNSKDAVLKFTLSKPTHLQMDVNSGSWNPVVGLFSSPPGVSSVKDNSASGNDKLAGVFDLGDIYGAVDTTVTGSDLGKVGTSDDWQSSVIGCNAYNPGKDQIFKFTPLADTRARITATAAGGAWNPVVAVFDDPPPSSAGITTTAAFDATTVVLPTGDNCLAYSFHDPAAPAPAHTYAVCPTKRYATDANTACVNAGMNYLASINSAEEQAFLMKTSLSTYTGGVFHMGGVDPDGDGVFTWRDSTALTYTNWLAGEPNGAAINNKCADINATGTWVDGKCTSAVTTDMMYYVCEDAAPAVLPNEDAVTAKAITPASTQVVTGNTRRMSSDYNGATLLSSCGGTIGGGDAVFSITTNSTTSYPLVVDSAGSSYGVVLGLFDGAIDSGHYLACDAPAGGVLTYMLLPSRTYYLLVKGTAATPEGQYKLKFSDGSVVAANGTELVCAEAVSGGVATAEVDVDANHTYYVVIDHKGSVNGKYDLDVHSLYRTRSEIANAERTNETGSNALSLPDPYRSRISVVDTSTAGMAADYGNGASAMCTTSPSAPDAVYKFTPSITTNVTFTVKPQGAGLSNVGIGVFDGPPGTNAVLHDLTASGNANESATSAEPVSLAGPAQLYEGNTSGMTADVDPSMLSCGARSNGHDAVFSFNLTKQTNVEIDASGSTVSDPVINLMRSGPLSKPTQVTLENDTKLNADTTPSPTPKATASWLYYGADFTHLSAESQVPVSLSAVNDDAPPGTLQPQELGDIDGKRFVISGGDTGPMLADFPGMSCGGNDASPDALYKLFSTTGGTVHVKATPQAGFNGVVALYDGQNGAPLRLSDVSTLVEDTACVPPNGPKNLTNATLKSISSVVAASPNISLNCGETTIITNDPDATGPLLIGTDNWCGTAPTVLVQSQPNGPELVIVVTKSMQIAAGSTLRVLGLRPVIFVVSGTATITGQLTASPNVVKFPGIAGAGADYGCGFSYGGNGLSSGNNSGGGGGGGFGTAGGEGGFGSSSSVAGGAGGVVRTTTGLEPLMGGCNGGDGATGSGGGLAAGALQISATTSIVVSAGTGSIAADGGNGVSGAGGEDGGSGAGSGGGILLQAPTVTYVASQLTARGGNGGLGSGSPSTSGGTGAANSASVGGVGQNSNAAAGGGGGGGGYGRVVVSTAAMSIAPCTVATNESTSNAWPIALDGSARQYQELGNTNTMVSDYGGMCGTPAGSRDAVYSFTLSQPATVQIDGRASAAGTVIGLYSAASLTAPPTPVALANDDRAAADLNPAPTPDVTGNWLSYTADFVGLAPNAQQQTVVDNTGNLNEIIPTELPDPIDRRITVTNANTSAMNADYLAATCSTPTADGARDAIYRFVPSKNGPVSVSANYSQTLFDPVVSLYSGTRQVMDERITLVNFSDATFANVNVDLSTVKVYDLDRATLYPSSAYTVIARDSNTPVVIKRNGGVIPSGTVVSVDYSYDGGAPLPVSQQQVTTVNLAAGGNKNENAATATQVPIQSGRDYVYTGDTTAMSSDVDGSLWKCGPPVASSRDATFDFSLDKTTSVAIYTEGSSFDTTVALFSAPYTRPSTSLMQSRAAYLTQLYDVQRVPGSPESNCSTFNSGGSLYWICPTARPWGQAEAMCAAVGLHLATIDSSGENTALFGQIQPTTNAHHIGFTEAQPYTDSWGVWTSGAGTPAGSPVSGNYTRWRANEPNGSGDCLQLLTDATWDDANCATAKPYVCERDDLTAVTAPSASCGSVLTHAGHNYFVCTDKQDWAVAKSLCSSSNMHLARVNDQPEDDQLQTWLSGAAGWVGGSDSAVEGTWVWTDAAGFWTDATFRNWVGGEPNEVSTNPGSRMLATSGQWVDTPATSGPFPYICENPLPPSSFPTAPTATSPEIVDVFSARRQFTGSTQSVSNSVTYAVPVCLAAAAAPDAVFSLQLPYQTTLTVDITGSFGNSMVALYKDALTSQGYTDAGSKCGLGASAGPQLTATLAAGSYYAVITGTSAAASGVYNVTFSAQTMDAKAFTMSNDTDVDARNNPLGSVDGKWLVKKTDMTSLLPSVTAVTSVNMSGRTDNDVNAVSLGSINDKQVLVTNATTTPLAADYPGGVGPVCGGTATGFDALYSFTVPDSDPIQVRFTPSGWNGQIAIYDGLPLTNANAPNAPIDLTLPPTSNSNETPVSARATATIGKAQAYLGNLTSMANDVPAAAFNQSVNAGGSACSADPVGSDAFFKFTVSGAPQTVEISSASTEVAHTIALWDDKPFSKPSGSTLEYDSRSGALAAPLGGADIDDTWVVARGDMSHFTPYNGYTTITENVDYTRDDTVHALGNVNGKEIVTVNANTTGLFGDYLATTLQCGGSSDTSPDAIFSFSHSVGGRVRLSLNNPTPGFAPSLSVFRGMPPQTAAVINPTQIMTGNANEATTSAFAADPVAASIIYTGNTSTMMNNYPGSVYTQGTAYGSKVCSADSGSTGRDAFVKFVVPAGPSKTVEIASLNASYDQTIALFDSTPIIAPTSPGTASYETRSAAYTNTLGTIDNDWLFRTATMSSLLPDGLTAQALTSATTPAVSNTDEVIDLASSVVGKRTTFSADTAGRYADYTAGAGGAVTCATSNTAPDIIYKLRPTTSTRIRAAVNNPSAPAISTAIAILDGSAGHPKRMVDTTPAATTTSACSAAFNYTPSNFTLGTGTSQVSFTSASATTLSCGLTLTYNSSTNTWSNFCSQTVPPAVYVTQTGGPEAVVLAFKSLNLAAGTTIKLTGSRPVVFAVETTATIAGVINASGTGGTPGAGGDWSCGTSSGGNGSGVSSLEGGGGGGGGFGTKGGAGGMDNGSAGGSAGAVRGTSTLTPLLGGCRGGEGFSCSTLPGGGGGAVQISTGGSLTVTGTISANGGVGAKATCNDSGGEGGGSGGGILLEGPTVTTTGATIQANGGAGGAGQASGAGGGGSTASASAGTNGSSGLGSGGGGGGGGYGRISTRLAPCRGTNEAATAASATTVPIGLTQTFSEPIGGMANDRPLSSSNWGTGCTPDASGPDAFWTFTLTRTTNVELKSGSSNFDHTLTLFNGSVSPLQCLNVNASATTTNITSSLAAGTYYVGIKSRNSNVGGTATISFRDTLAGAANATSLACSVGSYVDANLTANTDYYIIVKGASGTLAPAYNMVITDLGPVQQSACGDPSTADAFFDFTLASTRNVTISLNEVAGKLDGVFQLMRDAGTLNVTSDDTAVGGCIASSNTYASLAAGRYYVIVRAASLTGQTLPAEIYIKDENGANALDCAQVNNGGTGSITRTLAPGTYYAAITTRNGGVGNNYKLQIRDTALAPPSGGTWVGCADTGLNLDFTIPAGDANLPYYAIVKGASAGAAGTYTLTATDLDSVQDTCAAGAIQMDPTAPDAYYAFNVTDADGGGRDVTVSLASTSALDGAYQLFRVDSPSVRTPIGVCHDRTAPYTYADLIPGSYYLALRGKNVASGGANGAFELSVQDQDAYGSLTCQNGVAVTGAKITRLLNPGNYWVGIKPQAGQSNPKSYSLQFRDTASPEPVNATQIACGTGVVKATTVAPGKTYHVLVKGNTAADKGAYGLALTDLGASSDWGCNDDSGAGDAFFEFNVDDPDGRRVTIDTENSSLDTVLAIFPLGPPYGAGEKIACDDNSGATAKSSKLTVDLGPGVYYAAVRPALGAANPTLPFEISFRDESVYSSIACGATVGASKAQIRTTLGPGTYHAVVKGMTSSPQGAYKIRFRDETPYLNAASEVACNDAQNELVYNVTAGKPYYAVVKGASVSESGAYKLTVENVVARNGMGCGASATAADAVYRFHLSADTKVQIDTSGSQTGGMSPVATDTVIALYDSSASYFGTNYALDKYNAPVNCDDNSENLAKGWSRIVAELKGNRDYYVVVQSKNSGWASTLPFTVNVKDLSTNQPIACGSASSSLNVIEPLPAGDYRVVVSNSNGASGGAPFDVRFKNVTAASSGATEVTCADAPEEFTYNLVAGRSYYLLVKGAAASDRGQYGLVVETSGTGANSMGCGADPAAPDAFYKFTLTSQATVTIDTEDSVADTVIALYDGNTTVFGTNYTLDVNGVEVPCDDDGGLSAGASMIQTELAPGSYYVVVKGKTLGWNQATQPFNLSIRDQSNTGSIACASDTQGSKKILETLPPGDYQVVMSTRSALGGAYAVKFRDTALAGIENGSRVACVSGGSLTVNNLTGGHQYYLVVKGDGTNDAGGYNLTMEDTVSLAAATSSTSVACAAEGTTIDGTYPAGTYYALVTGTSNVEEGPYTLNVRDADAIDDQNRLACDDNGGPNNTSVIEKDLQAGTHYVVVKGNGDEARGAYRLHIRDTTAVPDREVACAGPEEAQRIQADVKAGQDYTVLLKGDAASASGAYDIKLYDQTGLQTGTGQNMKCLADPQPATLVNSTWHTKSLDFDLDLTPDTYYVAVKGVKAKDKGTFQLNIGEKGARTTTTYTPPTWTEVQDALATSAARVLPVIATGGEKLSSGLPTDEPPKYSSAYITAAESQAKTIATASKAVRKDGTPIWQRIQKDGTGTGSGLITGIAEIADYLAMDVSLVAVDGPDPGASKFQINIAPGNSSSCQQPHPLVDTSTGICTPQPGNPNGYACNTQYKCTPGAAPKFLVTFTNPASAPVPPNTNDAYGGYHFKLQIIGDGKYLLDEVPVYIIPTTHAPMGPPGGGSGSFAASGQYTQNILTAQCPKLSSSSSVTNDLPQWSDLYFKAGLPEGTSIDFELCAKPTETELKSCWSSGARKKVTVRGGGKCKNDNQCKNDPMTTYSDGFCVDEGCQFISEPKVTWDIPCIDNKPCPNGHLGAGEFDIASRCEVRSGAFGYGHCVYTTEPADLGATLATGEQGNQFASIRFTLHADAAGTQAPTLYQWNLTYSCKSAQ